jgi:recombination protein U
MAFEEIIEFSNQQYLQKGIASIWKVPTPVKVTKLQQNRIVSGFYEKKGLPDFKGTYKDGRSIVFDAKSTESETSFSLSNVHPHMNKF